jgi:hypothetical protein
MTDNYPPPPPPPPPPIPPYGLPPAGGPPGGRTGPPWEQPGPAFERFARTAQAVLLDPTAFFRNMRREGGLGQPLVFGIAGTLAGGIMTAVYQMLLSMLGAGFQGPDAVRDQAFVSLFSTGCMVVVIPLVTVLGMFIAAGIYHVMLLLLGAAGRPFETTMRVIAYGTGSTSLLNFIPVCGGFIGAIWSLIVAIIGLAQAHEITTGKAAAAVLIPFVACCILILFFYASALALIFGGAAMGGWQ